MVRIKKYSNRRLYDTRASAYVNLDQIAALIRAGEQVQVEDAATGEDLTRPVLLQILIEAGGSVALFPPGLLHRIIRGSVDSPLQRMAMKQAATGLELLDTQLSNLESQFGWMSGPRTKEADPMFCEEPAPQARYTAGPPPAPPVSPPTEAAADDLAGLRARLVALETRLKGG
jgi:polyhydroxyalkanoate synthesis repressor PhaR